MRRVVAAEFSAVIQEQVVTSRGKVRHLTVLPERAAPAYEASIAPSLGAIERRLGAGVMANRAMSSGGLRPHARERERFRVVLEARLGDGHAVLGDVRDCYPSVGLSAVGRALANVGADPSPCLALLEWLHGAGVRGLPIGPWPSAVLANLVLASADDAARTAGATVVRWVDDVILITADRVRAARALDAWAGALRRVGLEPHEGKTRIVPAEEARSALGTPRGVAAMGDHRVPADPRIHLSHFLPTQVLTAPRHAR